MINIYLYYYKIRTKINTAMSSITSESLTVSATNIKTENKRISDDALVNFDKSEVESNRKPRPRVPTINSDGIEIEMPIMKEARVVRSFVLLGTIPFLIDSKKQKKQIAIKIKNPEILSPIIMPRKIQ